MYTLNVSRLIKQRMIFNFFRFFIVSCIFELGLAADCFSCVFVDNGNRYFQLNVSQMYFIIHPCFSRNFVFKKFLFFSTIGDSECFNSTDLPVEQCPDGNFRINRYKDKFYICQQMDVLSFHSLVQILLQTGLKFLLYKEVVYRTTTIPAMVYYLRCLKWIYFRQSSQHINLKQ